MTPSGACSRIRILGFSRLGLRAGSTIRTRSSCALARVTTIPLRGAGRPRIRSVSLAGSINCVDPDGLEPETLGDYAWALADIFVREPIMCILGSECTPMEAATYIATGAAAGRVIRRSARLLRAEIVGVAASGVAGAEGAASRVLGFTARNLQKGFTKHGADFGLKGNWKPSRAADFSRTINQHINDPVVTAIEGTYRGAPATHYFNPATGVNVIADLAGNYVSGWRLGVEQMENLFRSGAVW
jgi:hypothetical protein